MKVIFVLLAVCFCYSYARESSTSPSSMNATTGSPVEKEDAIDKKPNLPVRMMPLTEHQNSRSGVQSDYPSGSSPRNSRTGYQMNPNPQALATEQRQRNPSSGRSGRQMLSGRPGEDNQRLGQPGQESQPSISPSPAFGYRAVWQDDRVAARAQREDEIQLPPTNERRDWNPRSQYARQPIDDGASNIDEGNQYGGEYLRSSMPAIDSRRQQGAGREARLENNPIARASPSEDNRQPRTSQDPAMSQPGHPRGLNRDQMYEQPKEDFQLPDSDRRFPLGQGPRPGHDGTWTSYRNYGVGSRDDDGGILYKAQDETAHQHRPYSFNYLSESDEGMHGHQQTADGSGKVIGSYTISLGDGRKRIVEYIADENGFRASIDSNEHGMSFNENPADIVYYNVPVATERRSVLPVDQGTRHQRVPAGIRPVAPTTTHSRRYPSYGSQNSREGAAAAPASAQVGHDSRILPPTNFPNEIPGFSMYDAPPMFPSRRRLPEPQDSDDEDDAPVYSRSSLDNTQDYPLDVNGQDISRQPSQPASYDGAPPNTRMRQQHPDRGQARPDSRGRSQFEADREPEPQGIPSLGQDYPAERSFMASGGSMHDGNNPNGNGNRFWFRRSA